jgi:hypothetical protein
VKEPATSLAAETGLAIFKVAFERWIQPKEKRGFAVLVHDSLDELPAAAG